MVVQMSYTGDLSPGSPVFCAPGGPRSVAPYGRPRQPHQPICGRLVNEGRGCGRIMQALLAPGLGVVVARLGSVAARAHVAPSSGPRARGVPEQPAAVPIA